MSPSTETTLRPRAGIPAWFLLSLLTVFLWGAWGLESKFVVERISPLANQVIFPLGFLPAMVCVLFSKNVGKGSNRKRGAVWAFLTGILGGVGNIAFYTALSRGGKAAIVVPLVGLAPLITVIMAAMFLKESITRPQIAGLVLAMISIYLLSI